MDDCLSRILSLLPVDESGKFSRGCKKDLADHIGLPHNTVAEWISGRNKSYLKYLYQISEKYGVSVEWLKGETDAKKPAAKVGDGLNEEILRLIGMLPLEEQEREVAYLRERVAAQGK